MTSCLYYRLAPRVNLLLFFFLILLHHRIRTVSYLRTGTTRTSATPWCIRKSLTLLPELTHRIQHSLIFPTFAFIILATITQAGSNVILDSKSCCSLFLGLISGYMPFTVPSTSQCSHFSCTNTLPGDRSSVQLRLDILL